MRSAIVVFACFWSKSAALAGSRIQCQPSLGGSRDDNTIVRSWISYAYRTHTRPRHASCSCKLKLEGLVLTPNGSYTNIHTQSILWASGDTGRSERQDAAASAHPPFTPSQCATWPFMRAAIEPWAGSIPRSSRWRREQWRSDTTDGHCHHHRHRHHTYHLDSRGATTYAQSYERGRRHAAAGHPQQIPSFFPPPVGREPFFAQHERPCRSPAKSSRTACKAIPIARRCLATRHGQTTRWRSPTRHRGEHRQVAGPDEKSAVGGWGGNSPVPAPLPAFLILYVAATQRGCWVTTWGAPSGFQAREGGFHERGMPPAEEQLPLRTAGTVRKAHTAAAGGDLTMLQRTAEGSWGEVCISPRAQRCNYHR